MNVNWTEMCSKIIKIELTKKGITYDGLSELLLKEVGIKEKATNIANKMSSGTFSFKYALQIFKAIGIKDIKIGEHYE